MFILRRNNTEIFRSKSLEKTMSMIPQYNSADVNVELWAEYVRPERQYRKNGRVRQQGYDHCKTLVRYLHSPMGGTGIKMNLSKAEREAIHG